MKIWELDWTPGRKYKDIDGDIWQVDSRGRDLIDDEYANITKYISHKMLATSDFEPVVDWSKVAVDTKVLISEDGVIWNKRYFAKYEDEKVFAFDGSYTSWITKRSTSWKYAKLAEEAQND